MLEDKIKYFCLFINMKAPVVFLQSYRFYFIIIELQFINGSILLTLVHLKYKGYMYYKHGEGRMKSRIIVDEIGA